jgi:type IV pilus assembly protein PilM
MQAEQKIFTESNWRLKMARIGVGVDIGHSSIKIIQIIKIKERFEVIGCARITLPAGSMNDDGLMADNDVIVKAIQQACVQAHVKQKKVITAIAGNAVIMKHLNLPLMLGPELGEIIRLEVEKFLSFPITEAEYDWDILRQQDNGEMELIVVAAPKKIITEQLTCLQLAGLQTKAVDIQPFAHLRSLEASMVETFNDFGGVAYLDIGSTMTQMIVYYDGSIRETRIITLAGDKISMAIAEQLQVSYEKAEALKCSLGDADYQFKESETDTESCRANRIIGQNLAELVIEIRRSVDYFKLQFPGTSIHGFILTGGSSKLRNLAPFLERELGTTVRLGDPLTHLQLNFKQTDCAVLLGNPYQFSAAIGSALRGVES